MPSLCFIIKIMRQQSNLQYHNNHVCFGGKAGLHGRLLDLRPQGHSLRTSWSPVYDRAFLDVIVARLSVVPVSSGRMEI